MIMKFEEQIKLDNFKAQYEIIRGNIGIANSELERVLEAKSEASRGIQETEERLAIARKELSDVLTEMKDKTSEADNKLALLYDREISVNELEKDTRKRIGSELKELETKKNGIEKSIIALEKINTDLKDTYSLMQSKMSSLEISLSELEQEVALLNSTKVELSKDIASLEDRKERATNAMNSTVEKLEKEIAILVNRAEEERSKVVDANEHFSKKEKELARRESDILVITKRLRDLYQEVRPGMALKI